MKSILKVSGKALALLLVFSIIFSSLATASPGPNFILINYNSETVVYAFDPTTGVDTNVHATFRYHITHALTNSPYESNISLHYTCGSFAAYDTHLSGLDFAAFLNHQDTSINNYSPLTYVLMTAGGAVNIDKTVLDITVEDAIYLAANVITAATVAEAGNNMWVTPAAHAAFESHIAGAKAVLNSICYTRTQADINTAVANLQNAIAVFNAEIYVSSAKSAVAPGIDLLVSTNLDAAIKAYEYAKDQVSALAISTIRTDLEARLTTVQGKIQAALAQTSPAAAARAIIERHDFDDITIYWSNSATDMLQVALNNIYTQVYNLQLANIDVDAISFLANETPAITVAGIPRSSHAIAVTITDNNAETVVANISVYITFKPRPLIHVYNQLAFQLPAGGIVMDTNINIVPQITTMEDGQNFRREWLTHYTVFTLYYELIDDSIPAPNAGNLRFAFYCHEANAVYSLQVSTNRSDSNSHAILDPIGLTLQSTREAFVNYSATRPSAVFGEFDGIVILADDGANIRVTGITIGTTTNDRIPLWKPNSSAPFRLPSGDIALGVDIRNPTIVDSYITVQRGSTEQILLLLNVSTLLLPFDPTVEWNVYDYHTGRHVRSSSISDRGVLSVHPSEQATRLIVKGGCVSDWNRYATIVVHVVD